MYSINGTVTYTYDEIGRLTRENNQALGATYIYSYNAGGNITSKQTCSYSTATSPTVVSEIVYTYNNSWTDQLTSWGSSTHPLTMQYDSHGNATKYKYSELDDTDSSIVQYTRGLMTQLGGYSFGYNASGVRTSKTKSSLYNYQYIVDGTSLLQEVYTSDSTTRTIQYAYTHHGLVGFLYNGNRYYYMRNVLGDIVAICDQSGDKLATYTYDAWGNHTVCDGDGTDVSDQSTHIANINPFRYRGY